MMVVRSILIACAGLALVAGCGGGSAPRADGNGPVLVAALGDSITAGSPAWDPDPGIRARLGDSADPESEFEYWADLNLRGAARFRNCGVFGQRTDEIAARLDACARGARVLLLQGGINDIAQRRPVERAAQDLRAMVRRGKALGLDVLLVDVLPWNNGGRRAAREIVRLNAMIAAIGRDEHVRVLGFNAALADPRDPARMRADLTSDGDHPSVAGYRRLGRLVVLP
jgi:lysophospholipase L1-like esterase